MFGLIKEYSHIFIHLSMMNGVILYVIFGAYIMQSLENNNIVEMNAQLRSKRNTKVEGYSMNSIRAESKNLETNYYKNFSGHDLAKLDNNLHNCVVKALESLFIFSHCQEENINVAAITLFDYCYKSATLKNDSLPSITDKFGEPIYNGLHGESNFDVKNYKDTPASVFFKKKFRHEHIKIEKQLDNNSDAIFEEQISMMDWSFGSSIIFAFSIITTIGYGHVAPMTTSGRIFTIIYGLVGVPFTLLTIANVGLFLTNIFKMTAIKIIVWKRRHFDRCVKRMKMKRKIKQHKNVNKSVNCCLRKKKKNDQKVQSVVWYTEKMSDNSKFNYTNEVVNDKEDSEDEVSESENAGTIQIIMTLLLAITTFLYILFGAYIVHLYENDMNFFQAFYFNFITLTTIGLGDFVPQSYDYLALTITYVFVGMALVTVTLNLLSDILKKLHNFGRKIENVGEVIVWFGGKKMKMSNLMKYLIDTLNLPEETLQTMNVDNFIDKAIQKEEGKIETLRPKPFSLSDMANKYSRDIEAETCFMDATERSSYYYLSGVPSTRRSTKNVIEKINHKVTHIPSISNKESLKNGMECYFKIQLNSVDTEKRWSSSDGITRKSFGDVFYLPTFETFSRSVDTSSFEDLTTNENKKIIR
uniref:TWiK family of potassium channels protein 9 (inferred by orthology to a C. elegans protein) n=1 Tax=Strongyloides venezuelensis TaxID=75913 RepID=A0A0K0EVI7_STRVS